MSTARMSRLMPMMSSSVLKNVLPTTGLKICLPQGLATAVMSSQTGSNYCRQRYHKQHRPSPERVKPLVNVESSQQHIYMNEPLEEKHVDLLGLCSAKETHWHCQCKMVSESLYNIVETSDNVGYEQSSDICHNSKRGSKFDYHSTSQFTDVSYEHNLDLNTFGYSRIPVPLQCNTVPVQYLPVASQYKSISQQYHVPYCQIHSLAARSSLLHNRHLLETRHSDFHLSQRQLFMSPKDILEQAPPWTKPYLRLIRFDKPIGSWLLFWPCTWSIALAADPGHLPSLYMLTLFGAGSFLMRGAGCIINDMWDKDFDRRVERTKLRPLASGELSYYQALKMLAVNLSLSLTILLQLNWFSVALGASSMILVIAYPLAKRYTYWPQILLGVTLNWGVLLSWSALHGCLEWPALAMYTACVFYTMFYDTIYAHQDKYDDMLIGVKSTALKFGEQTKPWLSGFGVAMVSGLLSAGVMCDQTWPYYAGVTATAAHLTYQLYTVDLDNPDDCFSKFRSNSRLGAIMFLAIVTGTLLKKPKKEKESQSHVKKTK